MRRLLTFLFLAASASAQQAHTLAEQYLYQSVNAERAATGLPPLTWNVPLQGAADFHANAMRSAQTLSHQLSGEPDLSVRAAHAGSRFSRVSENVGVGPSILQMHDALMHSPHHRENILDPAVDSIAIAVVASRGQLWAVEDFASTVEALSFARQEERVVTVLANHGIPAEPTPDARETCTQDSGYVGPRPGFVMRYTTADLNRLPDQLTARLQTGAYRAAAVGACQDVTSSFSSYSIAILLYR